MAYKKYKKPVRKIVKKYNRSSTKQLQRKGNMASTNMIIYSAPHNAVLPPVYYTKLHSRYQGTLGTVGFATGGAVFIIRSNDVYTPFGLLPAANITWANSTSPLALAASGHGTLGKVDLYETVICLAAQLKLTLHPSGTTSNDSTSVAITPTNTASGASPNGITAALKQQWTTSKTFHAQSEPLPLKNYVSWSKFIGVPKKDYENDPGGTYGQVYNAAPTSPLYQVINMQLADIAAPTATMPFVIELTQYVKYYKFSAGQINP